MSAPAEERRRPKIACWQGACPRCKYHICLCICGTDRDPAPQRGSSGERR